ncbi:MAG: glycoside hydrolase family 28 protein [Clostridiales bacterium]|nr:glycoside hydrolase family 28 protein [Clostridiales bacterium]
MSVFDFEVKICPFKNKEFVITDFGAVGDGKFVNTDVINSAISKCNEDGGGKVIVPRGIWLSGPIILKSNVELHLEDGAVILFSSNYDDYKLIYTSWEGFFTYRCISPIYAKECKNIAITGKGIIDGNGGAWRPVKRFKMTEKAWKSIVESGGVVVEGEEEIWWPTEAAMEANKAIIPNPSILKDEKLCEKYRDYLRPVLVNFTKCENVLIDGPTFQNSPAWAIHPWLCENMIIQNINVRNPWFSQNGDGIDVDSCKYVIVKNSTFDVGDDALCVKSGKNEDGRKLAVPCEFVRFENCTVYHGHGGFVIGSEMSGGVKEIYVKDCTFIGTDTGLRFKSCIGRGGVVEDVFIDGINMTEISKEAIVFTMGYDMDTKEGQSVKTEEIPEFKNIEIKNILCGKAETAISIMGLSERPVHHITFENVNITSKKPVFFEKAENIVQKNVSVIVESK